MGQVKWTDKSVNNLQAIHEYISKDSPIFASRFVNSLIKNARVLETQPYLGRVVPEFDNASIRELIYKNYRMVYRIVKEDTVEILTIFHGAQELYKID